MEANLLSLLRRSWPRIILFCLAVLNFLHLWLLSPTDPRIACVMCPWYHDWSYTNEPTVLLLAAAFLLINRVWATGFAVLFSLCVFVADAVLISRYGSFQWLIDKSGNWISDLKDPGNSSFLYEWETQVIFSLLVLGISSFYLIRAMQLRKRFD